MKLWNRLNSFVARAAAATQREEGQTMVEYGLIIALIALVVVGAVTLIGTGLDAKFRDILTNL